MYNLLALADYVVTSEDYPCTATGKSSVEEGLKALLLAHASRAKLVVVTLGAKGCLAFYRENPSVQLREIRIPAFRLSDAEIVDTTGAGDAFIGGLAYGIVNQFSIEDTLSVACWVASQNCRGKGGRGGLPRRDELTQWEAGRADVQRKRPRVAN